MTDLPVYYLHKKINYIEGIQGLYPVMDIPLQQSILGPSVEIGQMHIAGLYRKALGAP